MGNLWTAFAEAADARPDAPALVFGERVTSFGELKRLAEGLSGLLARRDIGSGRVVALQLPKRVETYGLLLACLRLGAPYVFVDPKNPPDRTGRIVGRIRPALLVTTGSSDNPHGAVMRVPAQGELGLAAGLPAVAPDPAPVTGADPAYVMFTSGSTGEPKGAVIPHQGVLSLMTWARQHVAPGPGERFTGINPLHFDNSVFDIYCGLINGAALVPIETGEETNPASWTRTMRAGRATVMFAVPTLFLILDRLGLLTPTAFPETRTFIFGGEGYPTPRLRDFQARFNGSARLINVYGPTETSCICSSITIDESLLQGCDSTFPPLGRMHAGFSHAVLDEAGRPVAAGAVGELWIGGPCVGLGYYADPAETARRFRQDPRQQNYRSIWYRSGDLVREDALGRLWFQGRVDNQVKVRGHRIELEEVDLAVQSIPGVLRAVAVVMGEGEEAELNIAYVADRAIMAEEIQRLCGEKLPAYMRPTRAMQLDDLPRNANGKVDRLATRTLLTRAQ